MVLWLSKCVSFDVGVLVSLNLSEIIVAAENGKVVQS